MEIKSAFITFSSDFALKQFLQKNKDVQKDEYEDIK